MAAERRRKGILNHFIRLFPSIQNEGEEQIIILLHKEMAWRVHGYNSSHEHSTSGPTITPQCPSHMPFQGAPKILRVNFGIYTEGGAFR